MFEERLVRFLHRMELRTWRYHRFTKKTPSHFQIFFQKLLGNFPFNLSHRQTHTHTLDPPGEALTAESFSVTELYL